MVTFVVYVSSVNCGVQVAECGVFVWCVFLVEYVCVVSFGVFCGVFAVCVCASVSVSVCAISTHTFICHSILYICL